MSSFVDNLQIISERIDAAAGKSGRNARDIELMAVTKTLNYSSVATALQSGISIIGENRVQEAAAKHSAAPRKYKLHLIGHLQRNKAKSAAGFFDCIESIDKLETAKVLNERCAQLNTEIDILVEYNTSGEETKSGFTAVDELKAAIEEIMKLQNIRIRGLMTIAPFTDDVLEVRKAFSSLKSLFDDIKPFIGDQAFSTLSMGMSSDYEIAIEEGATRVRLGTALFGSRR
ncbi:MAG: YggS family pyridoxal phosphate-dependent enzyme [Spirochaetales bacterium]|jgi:PLP dependent protein|nr:YggS family pyridoxal phosphate-dependent enzyme [Spirochaetales bacterium]